ncbi:group 1 glycosyl transferase [Aliidiomarina shirensis]|uniref:Group 1 glycosyl transferase n=1 Tax=Aliidiomarina shirensis TaxID=1048642 RepID=A0A432WU57_9GAMM|nr:glycosyltransferase [Aliidiomarina shirensis]RUO37321.1 group 1 glycosyl transferase [Aliidiomarina shirensis]
MKILVFAPYFVPGFKGGGPIKSIKNLVHRSSSPELEYHIITSDRDLGDTQPYESVEIGAWNQVDGMNVFYCANGMQGWLQIFRTLRSSDWDVIYINSFFAARFAIFPVLLSKLFGKRVILAPRGEFSEGALKIKAAKKNFFIKASRFLRIHSKVNWQATSPSERDDIAKVIGKKADVVLAGNISDNRFGEAHGTANDGNLRIVFLSRISEKKNLLGALKLLALSQKSIVFDIYGPIEDKAYWSECCAAIEQMPKQIKVKHCGNLNPEQVVATLSGYDLFFFPTFGENYGHVIVEALSAGLPILVSDCTPWRNLESLGLGWDIPLHEENKYVQIIDELAEMPPAQRLAMRAGVLNWAKEKFSNEDAILDNVNMFTNKRHER